LGTFKCVLSRRPRCRDWPKGRLVRSLPVRRLATECPQSRVRRVERWEAGRTGG